MICYRARPIDRAGDMPLKWREPMDAIDAALGELPVAVYRPERAWGVGPGTEVDRGLEVVNRAAVAAADCLVAFLPPLPTLGVGREIEAARAAGVPVLLLAPGDVPLWSGADCDRMDLSAQVAAEASRWVMEAASRRAGPRMGFVMGEGASMPKQAHSGDAGLDLTVVGTHLVSPGSFVDLPTGLRPVFPAGVWGRITGRSSSLRRRGLLVAEGIIDNGYTGPLFVGVWNLTSDPVHVQNGERLAQMVLHSVVTDRVSVVAVDRLPDTSRGSAGFGSSGV